MHAATLYNSIIRLDGFVESVISASLIVLFIRSQNPFFESYRGKYLLLITI